MAQQACFLVCVPPKRCMDAPIHKCSIVFPGNQVMAPVHSTHS